MCKKLKFHNCEIDSQWASDLRELTCEVKSESSVVKKDILAQSTKLLKSSFSMISVMYGKIKKTKLYRVATTTTQPAHLAVILAVLVVSISLNSHNTSTSNNSLRKFIYAATTATHFGSQIWMTFASGLSLYFSLPRHYFGEVQKVLFPLYFTLNSILSLATLLAHLNLSYSLSTTIVLTLCFFVELLVRLYLCDPLVRLICVKNEMEAKHGLGMEVGQLSHDSKLFEVKEYVSVHNSFRRLHTYIAFSNITCIGLSTVHLYFAVCN